MMRNMKPDATTRGESVLATVRADIVHGVLPPGSKLAFAMLTERYAASTGVLREVLPRLVEQGLVTSRAQLGYRVMTLSLADLRHLTAARVALEGQVLRQSIESGDTGWEGEVVAAHHRLSRTMMHDGDRLNPTWVDEHLGFHRTLQAGCPNPVLRDVAERLRTVAEVYRSAAAGMAGPLDDAGARHRALTDLAVGRRADDAVAMLQAHIEGSSEALARACFDSALTAAAPRQRLVDDAFAASA